MTVRFKNELERNITIKLGYANAKVRGHISLSLVKLTEINRSSNAKTQSARDLDAINHTRPAKRIDLYVRDRVAAHIWSS